MLHDNLLEFGEIHLQLYSKKYFLLKLSGQFMCYHDIYIEGMEVDGGDHDKGIEG